MLDSIKNKALVIASSICIVAIYIICMLLSDLKTQKEETSRQYNNFRTMSDSSKYFKDKCGSIVLEKGTLELTSKEFKESKNKEILVLKKYINDLNIKIKRIQQTTFTTVTLTDSGQVVLHDTIYRDTNSNTISPIKVGIFKDRWSEIQFRITADTMDFKLKTTDTLIAVYSYKFLDKWKLKNIFKWRKKELVFDVKCMRPNSYIYMQSINFKKPD